ncbi:hypothetical protein [Streptomyces abikoensis]|uniref:hypothetical protein n=1 Tax=Streptomyces abikoensis TaxID=97398 RepID=UPI0033C92A7C
MDGTLFLVMEFVQGRDLGRRLAEDGMPPVAMAVEWAERAAAALAAAQRPPIGSCRRRRGGVRGRRWRPDPLRPQRHHR